MHLISDAVIEASGIVFYCLIVPQVWSAFPLSRHLKEQILLNLFLYVNSDKEYLNHYPDVFARRL